MSSDYLPSGVLGCASYSPGDLRYVYACTTKFRLETTILHLILITSAVLAVGFFYAIFQKVVQNRRHAALRRAPATAAEVAASAAGAHAEAALRSARESAATPRAKLEAELRKLR
jgi:hypothetical protein